MQLHGVFSCQIQKEAQMRTHNHPFLLRLSDRDYARLERNALATGHTKTAYLRSLITGYIPREQPPPQFYTLTSELHAIGHNMNQIAARANATNHISTELFVAEAAKLRDILFEIKSAVLQPVKVANHGRHENVEY